MAATSGVSPLILDRAGLNRRARVHRPSSARSFEEGAQVRVNNLRRRLVRPVKATISLLDGAGAEVLSPTRIDVGQLGGRFLKNSMLQMMGPTSDSTADRAKA